MNQVTNQATNEATERVVTSVCGIPIEQLLTSNTKQTTKPTKQESSYQASNLFVRSDDAPVIELMGHTKSHVWAAPWGDDE